jgi:hypothetical protein
MDNKWDYIISVILGILCGYLLKKIFFSNNVIYRGPDSNEEKYKVYQEDDKCYRLVPKICICPINIKF